MPGVSVGVGSGLFGAGVLCGSAGSEVDGTDAAPIAGSVGVGTGVSVGGGSGVLVAVSVGIGSSVGVAVGSGVAVSVGGGSGVFVTISIGSGVFVAVSAGAGVWVAGSSVGDSVAVGDSSSTAAMATCGSVVGVGASPGFPVPSFEAAVEVGVSPPDGGFVGGTLPEPFPLLDVGAVSVGSRALPSLMPDVGSTCFS